MTSWVNFLILLFNSEILFLILYSSNLFLLFSYSFYNLSYLSFRFMFDFSLSIIFSFKFTIILFKSEVSKYNLSLYSSNFLLLSLSFYCLSYFSLTPIFIFYSSNISYFLLFNLLIYKLLLSPCSWILFMLFSFCNLSYLSFTSSMIVIFFSSLLPSFKFLFKFFISSVLIILFCCSWDKFALFSSSFCSLLYKFNILYVRLFWFSCFNSLFEDWSVIFFITSLFIVS